MQSPNLKTRSFIITLLGVSIAGCQQVPERTAQKHMTDNVLLQPWTGPYGGLPAFDKMQLEDLKPALETAMKMNLEEMEAIANNTEAPTFENTIEAMERSGKALDRVFAYYSIWSSNLSSPAFRDIQTEMAPKISAFRSKIIQNEKLFHRIAIAFLMNRKPY